MPVRGPLRGPTTLRSLPSYAGPFALLAAVTATATVGVGLGAAAADGLGGRPAVVLPLLLLGLVVVPVPATELARRRRATTTLVRLRGADEARLLLAAGGPAVVAALLGGTLGVATLVGAGPLLPTSWEVTASSGAGPGWAVATAAAATGLAGVCARLVSREPLAAALRPPVRTAPSGSASLVGVVGLVATLAASGAAVFLARTADSPTDAGALVLAASGLVAVTVGELVVRLLVHLSRRPGDGRSTGVVLGVRRAGDARQAARLRAAVAAGVVLVAVLSAAQATVDWADRSDRVRLGAPVQVAMPGTGAAEALALTRRLDPDGRWLMAAAVADSRAEPRLRVAWLDLARWDRVAGDFLDGTTATVGDRVAALTDAPAVELVSGSGLTATTDGDPEAVTLDVRYLDPGGLVSTATLDLADGPPGNPARVAVDCGDGCVLLSVSASGTAELATLTLGTTDLLAGGWVPAEPVDPAGDVGAPTADGGLVVGPVELVPATTTRAVPVLTAGSPTWDGPPRVVGIAGGDRAAAPVAAQAALPLVGASGLLADLPVALAGSGSQASAVHTLVLARADTPALLLEALTEAGGDRPATVGDPAGAVGAPRAGELHARRVVALAAAGLGVLVLLSGAGRRRRAHQHDRAALRLVGTAPRDLRSASLVEAGVLGATVALAVGVGGLLTAVAVAAGAGLVPTGAALLSLGAVVSVPVVLGGALGAGAVTALVAVATARGAVRRTAPAALLTGVTEVDA